MELIGKVAGMRLGMGGFKGFKGFKGLRVEGFGCSRLWPRIESFGID